MKLASGAYATREPDDQLLDPAMIEAMKTEIQEACDESRPDYVRKLGALATMFFDTPHYRKAVGMGWTLVDLFGISPVDVRDGKPKGLVPALVWSKTKGKLRGIDQEGAKIAVGSQDGQRILFFRPHPCPGTVPFWRSQGLVDA